MSYHGERIVPRAVHQRASSLFSSSQPLRAAVGGFKQASRRGLSDLQKPPKTSRLSRPSKVVRGGLQVASNVLSAERCKPSSCMVPRAIHCSSFSRSLVSTLQDSRIVISRWHDSKRMLDRSTSCSRNRKATGAFLFGPRQSFWLSRAMHRLLKLSVREWWLTVRKVCPISVTQIEVPAGTCQALWRGNLTRKVTCDW